MSTLLAIMCMYFVIWVNQPFFFFLPGLYSGLFSLMLPLFSPVFAECCNYGIQNQYPLNTGRTL